MPLKIAPVRKRTKLPLAADYTKEFKKDWIKLLHSGVCNMERLKALMILLIANDGPLHEIHLEHMLSGEWAGFHECHMGGDVLLIYSKSESQIVFVRAGSHAALFK